VEPRRSFRPWRRRGPDPSGEGDATAAKGGRPPKAPLTEAQRRRRRLLITIGAWACAVLAVVGGAFGFGWWAATTAAIAGQPNATATTLEVPISSLSGQGVVMPDVRGLDPDDALQVLADAGIEVSTVTTESRPAAGRSDIVIEQVPAFGAERPTEVVLTISEPAAVPDLAGLDVAEAVALLRELGAQIEQIGVYVPDVDEETVVAVSPVAGSPLPEGVTLTVTEAPSVAKLADIDNSGDCGFASELTMDGKDWAPGVSCSTSSSGESATWSLDNHVDVITGTIGILDAEEAGTSATVSVVGDGVVLATFVLGYGSSQSFELRTTGVVTLDVHLSSPDASRPQVGFGEFLAYGSSAGIADLRS
jgi:hypothetical protein